MVGTSHPRAAWFIEQGLYRGIQTFDELEARIRASPDANDRGDREKVKGDAWEIFVEGYLATQPQFNVRTHKEKSAAPQSWLDRLRITRRDIGIDGIFETRDGRLGAQQSKFRANGHRTSLTEGVDRLDSRAEHANVRIYVTNARSYDDTEVGNLVRQGRVHWIGGNIFEQLQPANFDNIAQWIEGAATPRIRKTPDGDRNRGQAQAIEHVVRGPNGLAHHDRCKMIVVSAAGKTLTGMFIAEAMQDVRTVLVLVPWRILVRQTLLEWLENTSWDPDEFEFRCVVSENNAATADDLAAFRDSADDLSDILVTTDVAKIRKFLTNKSGKRKLVVSTYHSSERVAEAMPRGMAFDLAIFDEAHRTAMPGGSYWTLALENCTNKTSKLLFWKRDPSPNGLSCKKRLFMTATERINRIRERRGQGGQDGEDEPVFSMDDVEVYGPTAHELGYARAVEMELVLPLRFHLTFALDEETENAIDQGVIRQLQDSLGRELSAEEYAVAQSIVQTMNESDISKVFTFHNRVERSKTMQALLRRELPEGSVVHQIDGSTPHSTRAAMFRDMEGDMPCVITSVGTIREGVNVPVVQMVSFAEPRRNPIDVTQIAGRAMRRNDATGKEFGDVHIPILLQRAEGEADGEVFNRSSYRTAIQTLKALETTVPIVQLLTMRLRRRVYRRGTGRAAPNDEETLNEHEIHVYVPPNVNRQQIIEGLCNEVRTTLGRRPYDMLEAFRIHRENGGDAWVPQNTENPIGMELDVHFGEALHAIQKTYSRVNAGIAERGDHWMTEEVIHEFEDAGFLWVSPIAGGRGRPRGGNTVPIGDTGTRIYIAALREFFQQNPEATTIQAPNANRRGTELTIVFHTVTYENVRLGYLKTNTRRKQTTRSLSPEDYWMWVNEGLDLRDYSINNHLPVGYDQTPETLRTRLEDRGMSSQEHRMWTEHGIDLGEYDPQHHTPLDPLDTLAQGE